jgi:glycosyltransferase involved in cell wall biosynthesis
VSLRVAYLLKSFPRLSETFILNEMLALRAQGVEVLVCALEHSGERTMHPAAEALLPEVVWMDATGDATDARVASVPRKQRGAALAGLRVAERLTAWGAQHLHAHFAGPAATAAAFAAEAAGLTFSFTAHAKDIFVEKVDWDWLGELGRRAHAVVTVSGFNREFLESRLPGARIELIYNGVDLARFVPARRRAGARPGPIVGVGRFVRKKGFHVLVEAVALLRDMGYDPRVVLAGGGAEEGALRARARELKLGGALRFAGSLTQPEVRTLLRRASLVALPCVVDTDGNQDALPTVLLEAAACGVPCVSTRVAGVPEIVAHGRTGYVTAPGDARAVARAIARLLDSPARRDRMGAAARRRAERLFDQDAASRALVRLYSGAAFHSQHEETYAHRAAQS